MALTDDPLLAVFRETMLNENVQVTDETTFEDVPEWDSVAHVNLISAIEERFGVKFTTAEILDMNSIGAIRRALTNPA